MIQARRLQILKCLVNVISPISLKELSEKFNKSERTIRNDIKILRDETLPYGIDIRNKSNEGYYIPNELKAIASQFIGDLSNESLEIDVENEATNRMQTIFLFMLDAKKEVTADELADELFLSKSTIFRTLKEESHRNKSLSISSVHSRGYRINGDEYAIREYATKLLSNEQEGIFFSDDYYQNLPLVIKNKVPLVTVHILFNAISNVISEYKLWISNKLFLQLLSYAIVRHLRFQQPNDVAPVKDEKLPFAEALLQVLPYKECMHWNLEISYLNNLLKPIQNSGKLRKKFDLNDVEECTDNMISYLHSHSRIAFHEERLKDDLLEHLSNYVINDIYFSNDDESSLVHEIESKYPYYYEFASKCAEIFTQKFKLILSPVEISYIAIYLFKNRVNDIPRKARVYIVCSMGKGLSNLLSVRISNIFPEIDIIDKLSVHQASMLRKDHDIDLIISTIPIKVNDISVIKISSYLSNADIQNIRSFLNIEKYQDQSYAESDKNNALVKNDTFDLLNKTLMTQIDAVGLSTMISKVILTLIETVNNLPISLNNMNDVVMGLIIHTIMSIPRWIGGKFNTENIGLEKYMNIKKINEEVFNKMEDFFLLVEQALQVEIPYGERFAFYIYIYYEEDVYERINS